MKYDVFTFSNKDLREIIRIMINKTSFGWSIKSVRTTVAFCDETGILKNVIQVVFRKKG